MYSHSLTPIPFSGLFGICMRCRVCAIATSIFFSIDGTDWSTWNRWAEGMLDGRIIEWWKCQLCLISILFFTLSQNIELGIFTKERDLNKNQWMPIVWVWQPCFCPGPFPCNPDSKCCGYSFSHSSSHPLNPSKNKATSGPGALTVPAAGVGEQMCRTQTEHTKISF